MDKPTPYLRNKINSLPRLINRISKALACVVLSITPLLYLQADEQMPPAKSLVWRLLYEPYSSLTKERELEKVFSKYKRQAKTRDELLVIEILHDYFSCSLFGIPKKCQIKRALDNKTWKSFVRVLNLALKKTDGHVGPLIWCANRVLIGKLERTELNSCLDNPPKGDPIPPMDKSRPIT